MHSYTLGDWSYNVLHLCRSFGSILAMLGDCGSISISYVSSGSLLLTCDSLAIFGCCGRCVRRGVVKSVLSSGLNLIAAVAPSFLSIHGSLDRFF